MQKKAFVLLSGGLDSTTALYTAARDFFPAEGLGHNGIGYDEWVIDRVRDVEATGWSAAPDCSWVEAVSIFYNQRHKRELDFAKESCRILGINHTILDVGNLLGGKEVLLSGESIGHMDMVHKSYDDIKGVSPSYVPFRNGLLLSAITAHAQKYVNSQITKEEGELREAARALDGDVVDLRDFKSHATAEAKDLVTIYYGAHAEDAANWAYPDCTPEFNGSMANAIYTGSYNTIRLATPLQWMKKHEIVDLGSMLDVQYQHTWSCYDNGEKHCGKCPTCLARKEAFRTAQVEDPTEYAASQ